MSKKMELTPEQRLAVEKRGTNILVSAAAGSGKTKILVDRILSLMIEEKIPIDSMLIVTFTNAAAGEMKERLEKSMMLRLEREGISQEEENFLNLQIRRLSSAHVSTMHAFCLGLIREYFHYLDKDPSIRIASDRTVAILKQKAMEELLENYYAQDDPGFYALVESYGGDKEDILLQQMILQTHRFIQSNVDPLNWLEEKVKVLSNSPEEFEYSPIAKALKLHLHKKLVQITDSAKNGLDLVAAYSGLDKYLHTAHEDFQTLIELIPILENNALENFFQKVAEQSFGRLPTISKKNLEDEEMQAADLYKDIRNKEIKGALKDIGLILGKRPLSLYLQDLQNMEPLIQTLFKAVKGFEDLYQNKKQEMGVMDFGDIEHLALKLLEDQEIASKLRDKFAYIFFDEYQDSNLVQEELIGRICREDNLFFVGDVKQSIYKFRLAEPALFNRRYALYNGECSAKSCAIDLTKNFRSRKEILDFCNYIFSHLMSKDMGDVDYKEKSHQLVTGSEFLETTSAVELLLLEKDEDTVVNQDKDPEASAIAQKILNLLGTPRMKPGGETVPYEFRDMVILMRSPRRRQEAFAKILQSYKIPVYLENSTQSYHAPEVGMLLDFLRVIDNSLQDQPLIGALSSPFGKISPKEMAEIRSEFPEGSFAAAAQAYSQNHDNAIAEKYLKFMEQVQILREKEGLLSLVDFLWDLMMDTGYYTIIGALIGGEERQNNIRAFVQQAAEFDGSTGMGLFGFLRHVDKIVKEKGDTLDAPSAVAENQNVVRVMSIHKSKGLEFPVVFLADLARKFNMSDFRENLLLHNELGIGPKIIQGDKGIFNESLPRRIIKEQKKAEILSEEVRILYVALTRAQDRLIFTGTTPHVDKLLGNAAKGNLKEYLQSKTNYLAWILGVLIRSSQGETLREKGQIFLHPSQIDLQKCPSIKITFVPKSLSDSRQKSLPYEKLKDTLDEDCRLSPEKIETLEKSLSWKYPFDQDVHLPVKLTVSQIAKGRLYLQTLVQEDVKDDNIPWEKDLSEDNKENKVDMAMNFPMFMQTKASFSAADRGTIFHRLFQHLKGIKADHQSVKEFVASLIDKEILTHQEAQIISYKQVMDFLNSEIGMRIKAAEPEVYREKSFSMLYQGFLVDGKIDCYFFEGENLILVDYKTDRDVDEDRYTKQMELYAEALELWYKQKVSQGYIYWASHGITTKII